MISLLLRKIYVLNFLHNEHYWCAYCEIYYSRLFVSPFQVTRLSIISHAAIKDPNWNHYYYSSLHYIHTRSHSNWCMDLRASFFAKTLSNIFSTVCCNIFSLFIAVFFIKMLVMCLVKVIAHVTLALTYTIISSKHFGLVKQSFARANLILKHQFLWSPTCSLNTVFNVILVQKKNLCLWHTLDLLTQVKIAQWDSTLLRTWYF